MKEEGKARGRVKEEGRRRGEEGSEKRGGEG